MATAGNIGKGETLLINIKTQYDGGVAQVGKEIEKQSKYASRYFNQLNKDWITLRESYKAFLQNKNDKGVASLNVPSNLLQQQKAQQRVFDKAQKAFKVYTDNQITSQEELNKLLNNTIPQNITRLKEEQRALSQLSKLPTLTFHIREKGQTFDKTFEELVKDRIKKNSAFKLYGNIQNLIAGKKPENIQRGLNNFLPFPTVKEAKAQLKAESKKLTDLLTKQAKGEVVDTKAINELQQKVTYLQGLSDKNKRLDTIAKYLSTDKEKAKEIITKIKQDSTLAPIHALQKFRNNQSITPEQERMVADLLNSNGISVEKTKEHFALSNDLGKYQRQLTTIQQLAKSFTQDETNLKNAQNELNKTNAEIAKQQTTITQQGINKGRRDYLQTLVNVTSRKNGSNYFSDLRQQILTEENIPDRKRRLEEYTKKTREIAGYATNVMQLYGLDPKLFAWNEKEFNQHLKEIREKNPGTINRKEARLINKLYRNIALDLVDENDLFKNRAIQQTNILPYFERFKQFDSEFLNKTAPVVPSKTTAKDIINLSAGFQQDLERTKGIQKNILSALNSYTGMNLKENFTQEDLNNQLKTATKLSTDEQKNVRELGQGYLIASKRANEFSEAITKINNNLYANDINNLISDSKKYLNDFQKISKKPAFTNLLAGNKVEANAFIPIDILTKQIENLTNVTAKQLKTLGVEIAPKQANAVAENVFQRFERSSKYASLKPNEKQAYESLKTTFVPLNSAYGELHGASEVQLRRHSEQIKTEAQIQKQTQKDIMDDINQKNMSLYALSHALKSVEAPLMQGYETGKGSINEYVNFQSAMVGVAKLLPALRDKDTLVVNDKFTEFRQGILDLTETLPRSGNELAQASEVASRLGVTNPDQIRKVVEAGTKLGVAFGMAPNDVTSQIVKIANAKGIDVNKSDSMERIMEFADAINYLDDHTAASGREIINFTKKAVQTAEGVKMDTKDVSAFGASLVSLGISSDSANTAFKNLMTVLQTGPRNKKTGVEYLEKSGYSVKQLTTEFKKNPTKTAVEFIKRLNKLRNAPAGADAAAIVRFAFGQMSSQGIMALVNNPEVLEKYLKMARQDSKGWTEKEFKARQINDPAVRFKLLDNAVKKLQIDTGEMLMPIAQAFINDIKSFSKQISPAVKEHGDILRTGAYAGLGLLGLTKVGGFITDTAMLSNNLRNFKWYNDFVKSKYKTNKLSYNAPMILTNGELINGVWNKGTSIKNNRNLWNRFSFRAGVYGGKKEFLQLYRQFGSMRNNPAMYNNGKAIGELANVTKAMNAMKWKGGLQAGLALLPTLFSIPTLAGLAGIGTATYFTANYVSGQIDKKIIEAEKKRKNIIGTKKEREYRNNRLHSNVFQYEKLYKLQNELNKRGYEVANVNGDFIVNKLIKDKKGNVINKQRLKEERKNGGISYYLQEGTNAEKWGLSKGELLFTENNGADFLNLVDEIKYLKSQQKASETRAGIKPTIIRNEKGQIIDKNTQKQLNYQDPTTGEMINYVHPTNIEGWNWLSNEQRRASKVAKEQAEKKQKLLKKQKKAEEEGDIENFYSTTQALDSLRKNIIKTEEYEKNLRKRGAETDWEEESGFDIYKYAPKHSLQRKLNKSTQKHYLNMLKVYGFDKFGTEEQQTWALNLAERLEQQEYWSKMRKNLGIAKQNKEKGIKDFYGESFVYDNNKLNPLGVNGYQQANDTLYRLNQEIIQLKAKLGEQSKDVKPISQFQYDKFDFTNGFMTEEFNKALSSQQKENNDNLNKQKETTKAIADNYSTVKTNSTEAFSAINSGARETNQQISSIDSMLKSIATTLAGLTTGNHVIKIGFSLASSIPQLVPLLTGGGGKKKGGKRKGYNTYENEDD